MSNTDNTDPAHPASELTEVVEAGLDGLGVPWKRPRGRAEGALSGVRFGLAQREALVWTELPAGTTERAVTEAVASVATGARLLAREASALLNSDVAAAYLRFFGAGRETTPG